MGIDAEEAQRRLGNAWAALAALRGEMVALVRDVPQVRDSPHWGRACEKSRRVGGDVSAAREALEPDPAPEQADPDDRRELVRETEWAASR